MFAILTVMLSIIISYSQKLKYHRNYHKVIRENDLKTKTKNTECRAEAPRCNHNKETALHFYKNDAIKAYRPSDKVLGAQIIYYLPSTATDNVSRGKNKQTTHLKRLRAVI